jgi:hypothetical protein
MLVRRSLATFAFAAAVLASISCDDRSRPTPPSAPVADASTADASASSIQAQIDALFPPPYLRIAGGYFGSIRRNKAVGNDALALQRTAEFAAFFIVPRFKDGRLRDPNGSAPPTTQQAVLDLIRDLYVFIGRDAPDISQGALGERGTVGYVDQRGGIVTTPDAFAGVSIPPGALSGPVLITLERLDDPETPREGPLKTELDQWPLFYRIETFPRVERLNVPARLGICQVTDPASAFYAPEAVHDRLRIARANTSDSVLTDVLPVAGGIEFLRCVDVDVQGSPIPGALRRVGVTEQTAAGRGWMLAARAAAAARDWLGPATAYAAHGGRSAARSSFSIFGSGASQSGPGLGSLTVCKPGATAAVEGVKFGDLADAVPAAAPGATIRVCAGEYAVAPLTVTRPLTIEGEEGAQPLVRAADPATAVTLTVSGVRSGTVSLRNLRFEVAREAAVAVVTPFDQVVVENAAFIGTQGGNGTPSNLFVGPSSVPGAHAVVRNSTFAGGRIGVLAIGAPSLDLLDNTLSDFSFSGVQFQLGSSGSITHNALRDCGSEHCIAVFDAPSAEIADNLVEGDAARHTDHGIIASAAPGGTLTVERNTVDGAASGPRDAAASYEFGAAGIQLAGATAVTLAGNVVTGAFRGIDAAAGTPFTATDNSVRTTRTALAGPNGTSSDNDFADYVLPFEDVGDSELTCNWWGAAGGPQGVPAGVDPLLFTPWATAPTANADAPCNGGVAASLAASRAPPTPRR